MGQVGKEIKGEMKEEIRYLGKEKGKRGIE